MNDEEKELQRFIDDVLFESDPEKAQAALGELINDTMISKLIRDNGIDIFNLDTEAISRLRIQARPYAIERTEALSNTVSASLLTQILAAKKDLWQSAPGEPETFEDYLAAAYEGHPDWYNRYAQRLTDTLPYLAKVAGVDPVKLVSTPRARAKAEVLVDAISRSLETIPEDKVSELVAEVLDPDMARAEFRSKLIQRGMRQTSITKVDGLRFYNGRTEEVLLLKGTHDQIELLMRRLEHYISTQDTGSRQVAGQFIGE